MKSLEICAGAGGQALGLERAGFEHLALVEIETHACNTLLYNRPHWNVICENICNFSATDYRGHVDLFAGGVPCPPFSKAGKQLGHKDERDLFPEALRLISECQPRAVMLENVRGFLDKRFESYRRDLVKALGKLGFETFFNLLKASDFGVSQLRPRVVIVALRKEIVPFFKWPEPIEPSPPTVGQLLYSLLSADGWEGADILRKKANKIAPTLVGGSKKHGGADLGPTRAKRAWAELGIDAMGLADAPPQKGFLGNPRLTVEMAKVIQGFPLDWHLAARKTNAYRQVGNAFPPPVAEKVGNSIKTALTKALVASNG